MKLDIKNGLSTESVQESRELYGENVLPSQKKFSSIEIFIEQFKSPLVLILIAAAVMTVILEGQHYPSIFHIPEFVAIILVILINAILGFFQEYKAQNTLETLKASLKNFTFVIRDSKTLQINTTEVVVGDVIEVKFGDKIPADGVVFESNNISINEASMTGETIPVYKHAYELADIDINELVKLEIPSENTIKMGTNVITGFGKFVVTKVGLNSEFGKIAKNVVEGKDTLTPLQAKLSNLSKLLSIFAIGSSALVFIIGMIRQLDITEIFQISVSLAVASVPEALVISLTVVLTVGMTRLLKQKALVRKLIVAETLGSVNTICIDKTGTLTYGEMEVIDIKCKNEDLTLLINSLYYNNNNLNSVDKAVSNWLQSKNISNKITNEDTLDRLPFDSKNKYSICLNSDNFYVVGAPDILLNKSALTDQEKNKWLESIEEITMMGKRLIGVGYKPNTNSKTIDDSSINNLNWLGLVIIEDPIRKDVSEVLQQTLSAGIDIKVITGDFKNTALYVMNKLNIKLGDTEILSGEELQQLNDIELNDRIDSIKLFYRTNPEQKLQIVEALQAKGISVAMMGDGINDAPALKKANVGIVVDNASEVSKETADIVLLDSNFKTVISAIEEGRSIFNNLKKIITYVLTDSLGELILIGGSILIGLPVPLIPLQILYINIIVDGLPDLALAFEPKEKDVLNNPSTRNKNLFDNEVKSLIVVIGVVVSLVLLATYAYLNSIGYPHINIRSIIFAFLTVNTLVYVFPIKSLSKNIFEIPIFNNIILNVAVLFGFLALILAFTIPGLRDLLEIVPLRGEEMVYIAITALINVGIIEVIKYLFNRKDR